ncbi:hypothetical protein [Singulisphaera acidiphila]|uniref:Uncharacterized protein n=1 Tax=Singulisphaera acidiphila (strain ATCC BAA-1392 / DSM 18658 / VKM B-2454 / MOB10) TaxID=886293 RepID=L0DB11_SINAD|nr:hypothetical protein [Singulisphaera acidiphila]AGA26045.1 hypothetical protein Sinac_1667 [Singulisphaera acidiphila DSM 18658]
MLRDHRRKRIVKRNVHVTIQNFYGPKVTPTSREAAKVPSTRNQPYPAPEAGQESVPQADSRNDGHRGQYDPGLETYDGKSRIALILAVEKATDYDRTDPHCPSCGQAKGEMVVFMVAGGNVCRACPACFVGFSKRA